MCDRLTPTDISTVVRICQVKQTFGRPRGAAAVEQTNATLFQLLLVRDGSPTQHLFFPTLAFDKVSPFPLHVLQLSLPAHAVQDQHPVEREPAFLRRLDRHVLAVGAGHDQPAPALLDLPRQLGVGIAGARGGEDAPRGDDAIEDGGQQDLARRDADDHVLARPARPDAMCVA